MARGLCLTLAMAAVAAAPPAAAQSFETFRKFCLDAGGVPEGSLAALGQAGWETDPRTANLPAGLSVTLMSDPTAGTPPPEMVMVGFIAAPTGRSLPACSVMGPVVEAELVEQQVTGWTGFAPARSAQGWASWVYSGGPGQVTPQPDLVDASEVELLAATRTRGTVYSIQLRMARAGPFLFLSNWPDAPVLPAD